MRTHNHSPAPTATAISASAIEAAIRICRDPITAQRDRRVRGRFTGMDMPMTVRSRSNIFGC
jgi:hypothetical protein